MHHGGRLKLEHEINSAANKNLVDISSSSFSFLYLVMYKKNSCNFILTNLILQAVCSLITYFIQQNGTTTTTRARVKVILLPIIWREVKISEKQHPQCSKNQAQRYKCFWNLFSFRFVYSSAWFKTTISRGWDGKKRNQISWL